MKILKNDEPELGMIAQPVEKGEDVGLLVTDMLMEMYAKKGIGLAANQVGVLKRVVVAHIDGFKLEIINPVITKTHNGIKALSIEGCLSYPGKMVKVRRFKQITVEGFDPDWNPIKQKLKGLNAACIQHEIDHLNGITIVNKKVKK